MTDSQTRGGDVPVTTVIALPPGLYAEVVAFQGEQMLESLDEAVRVLLTLGLETAGAEE
jgi:hypothetical protein